MQECINVFMDTLVSSGLQDVVVSPGSRNAPLMLALARVINLKVHSVVDERSAAYTALGISMASGRPTALVCTSGTAAINYYPAIAEAYYARIPLLILTADRPSGLIDQWEGQCIRQQGLYANHIRNEYQTPEDYKDPEIFKEMAARAYQNSIRLSPGPVHVNIPLKEPLYNQSELQARKVTVDQRVYLDKISASPSNVDQQYVHEFLSKYDKILVVIGAPESFDALYPKPLTLPPTSGYVILPDLLSGLPAPPELKYWDGFLQTSTGIPGELKPDIVLSFGTHCLSKGLNRFLKEMKPEHQFHFHLIEPVGNPFESRLSTVLSDYESFCKLLEAVPKDNGYLMKWENTLTSWRENFQNLPWQGFNEFSACKYVLDHLPPEKQLHFSNSLPVRYASFLNANNTHRIYANRGTSGIDGCTSTALGYALRHTGDVVLITGDLAFHYDLNALWRNQIPGNFKIVLLNNQGGGIFDLIDGPSSQPLISAWQQTPVDVKAELLSKTYGLTYFRAENFNELRTAFSGWEKSVGTAILEIRTKKSDNKAFYSKFTGKGTGV
jgi:2-succinyl-5-enolpyruvyl-6-hydroxy-3-cyclohexene-1-carboxylate synthase